MATDGKICARCGKDFRTNIVTGLCHSCRVTVRNMIARGAAQSADFVDHLPAGDRYRGIWIKYLEHGQKALEGIGSIKSADALPAITMQAPQPVVRESWQDEAGENFICRTFEDGCKLIADFLKTWAA